jgi:hypothetical protein
MEKKQKPAVLKVCGKTSDLFSCVVTDENGAQIGDTYEGYVPKFFPGEHYGDYIMLDIDIETGKILNWKKPTQAQVLELTKGAA